MCELMSSDSWVLLLTRYDHYTISLLLNTSSLSLFKWEYIHLSLSVTMLSKNFNHLWITKKIQLRDVLSLFSCDYCTFQSINCFVMKSQLKCDKCTHHDHLCVSVLWESLDWTCLLLQKQISRANNNLAVKHVKFAALSSKVVCLQKILNQVNHHATEKVNCLAAELDSDNDETENEASSELSQFVNFLSSFFWDSIVSPSQNIKAFLHSSWGFLLVPKLILRYHILFTWQDSELSH